ncbi:hypothetical protein ASPWEDRAFT_177691 [Aspergillus wentii DTO 134E9]|uniref:AB hydrolase-1 domain-containing protein n=1 Tax=Aspergillus wentii DTO 134E9 TaxID=1073089 RepID=A0A1L9R4Y0_ASPWE|nr:uncharacterized protein ASPWEDRAFT_177691 [Aspergillus wentii DTO 134E9]KAI9927233.1 hypothetical protein MW887_003619 [Aspergillus wentii]OJJ29958.1 hypothetical protein ASPWEDRAFT_177691 [Aspergillus wentii DTO 134E9]
MASFFLLALFTVLASGLAGAQYPLKSDATLSDAHTRSYFYAGGQYTLNDDGEYIFTNQIYVEKLTPEKVTKPYPIVFIHGQAQTATNWLNKPDGQPGWASYFLKQGYECYLFDQTFRGRSPWQSFNGELQTYSTKHIQQFFTATEKYNLWPQASLHTQWPGSGVMNDTIFDAYYASTVPFVDSATAQEAGVQKAGAALLDIIKKPVIIVGHSQGGVMTWLLADQRPEYVHSIVVIEPQGPPFQNVGAWNGTARVYGLADIPVAYSPHLSDPSDFVKKTISSNTTEIAECVIQADDPPPRQLANISKIPVLLVTTESSYHAQYDWCTVKFLRQAGVKTEHLELKNIGIHGNGHMVFLEKNSDVVAAAIQKRMEAL